MRTSKKRLAYVAACTLAVSFAVVAFLMAGHSAISSGRGTVDWLRDRLLPRRSLPLPPPEPPSVELRLSGPGAEWAEDSRRQPRDRQNAARWEQINVTRVPAELVDVANDALSQRPVMRLGPDQEAAYLGRTLRNEEGGYGDYRGYLVRGLEPAAPDGPGSRSQYDYSPSIKSLFVSVFAGPSGVVVKQPCVVFVKGDLETVHFRFAR